MAIETIFANVSCSDLSVSEPWYQKLFGRAADRHPMAGLAEWHFTASAEVQLYEGEERSPQATKWSCRPFRAMNAASQSERQAKAGHSTLTLGVLPLGEERARLVAAGSEERRTQCVSRSVDLRKR